MALLFPSADDEPDAPLQIDWIPRPHSLKISLKTDTIDAEVSWVDPPTGSFSSTTSHAVGIRSTAASIGNSRTAN